MLSHTSARRILLGAALLLLAGLPVYSQGGTAKLLVTTDMDCDWKLDGAPQGRLKAEDGKVVPASFGKHLIQAVSADGLDQWKGVVNIELEGQEMVEIKLRVARTRRVQAAEDRKPTWTDPGTGLMWIKRDNGSNVTWQEAIDYCSSLNVSRYAGYSDWRLPAIDELVRIYDSSQRWNNKGRLMWTGWQWSATAGRKSKEAWDFNFGNKRQVSSRVRDSWGGRAFCVRRSGGE